jgi:hypothetical protein
MPRKPTSRPTAVPRRKAAQTSAPARAVRDVGALLDAARHPHRDVIDAMRTLIAAAVPTAVESIKWNAPSFATVEHFATFHLRAKSGVQLVLHMDAKPRSRGDLRRRITDDTGLLEWKGPDRALVTIRDAAHLKAVRSTLATVIAQWAAQLTRASERSGAPTPAPGGRAAARGAAGR